MCGISIQQLNSTFKMLTSIFVTALFLGCAAKPLVVADFKEVKEKESWSAETGKVKVFKFKPKKTATKFSGTTKGCKKKPCKTFVLTKEGEWDFSDYNTMMVEARGTKAKYYFVVQDKKASKQGITYEAPFDPVSKKIKVERISLDDFVPHKDGDPIEEDHVINWEKINKIGLRIIPRKKSKKKKFTLYMNSFWLEAI